MRILVISPHPDDETLGCGGTLLRHYNEGDEVYCLIVTSMSIEDGWQKEKISSREKEINQINKIYDFKKIFTLGFPTTKLDEVSQSELINKITDVYKLIKPEIIYTPFNNDVHTDHQIISKVMNSTFKWFRYPFIKKVLMYETISETDFNFSSSNVFKPNVYIDISSYLDQKLEILKIYKSEIDKFPFPRSLEAVKALALLRGSQGGFHAAECFQLVLNRR